MVESMDLASKSMKVTTINITNNDVATTSIKTSLHMLENSGVCTLLVTLPKSANLNEPRWVIQGK